MSLQIFDSSAKKRVVVREHEVCSRKEKEKDSYLPLSSKKMSLLVDNNFAHLVPFINCSNEETVFYLSIDTMVGQTSKVPNLVLL